MDAIGKAIIYIRESNYEAAIQEIANVTDAISFVADAIMKDREYYDLVSVESICEMLQGILDAKQDQDYILVADLLELQMETFICSVQNYIMNKEDLPIFEQSTYYKQIQDLESKVVDCDIFEEESMEELSTTELLEKGYRIEFTSCGLMTLAAENQNGIAHYLHTNHKISQEAFLLARSWRESNIHTYVIYGLGLGYHIMELIKLDREAAFEIYEGDLNILKLCCAFSNIEEILSNSKVKIIFDPDFSQFEKRRKEVQAHEKVCIHYPSYERTSLHVVQ